MFENINDLTDLIIIKPDVTVVHSNPIFKLLLKANKQIFFKSGLNWEFIAENWVKKI